LKREDFTFIITTFRSENIINDCLDQLPSECKKIIVENSGNIELKDQLEKKYKNLEYFVMKENLGYGKANNFGIKKSSTKYIFILNPDVILTNEKFDEIISNLRNESFSVAAPIEKLNKINFKNKRVLEVNEVKGFAMIIKREVALTKLFDENIFLYLEEIDFCNRVRAKNGRILIINTKVNHLGGLSHGNKDDVEMEKSRNWHWMWSTFYFYRKYNGYLYALLITLPRFISYFIKFNFYSIIKNEKKKEIYRMRFFGLFTSYLLKKSYYRPYKSKI
tara:strand:+ start:291 stop:1121 length:831 start_codon:yes stop_codon:yes gene_type:complete